MKLIIKNQSGQYYNGECFGPREAAAEYPSPNELPGQILDNDGHDLEVTLYSISPVDAGYYYTVWGEGPKDNDNCQARVEVAG